MEMIAHTLDPLCSYCRAKKASSACNLEGGLCADCMKEITSHNSYVLYSNKDDSH